MSSDGKSMVSGAFKSEKPKGAAADSAPETTKLNSAPNVSSDLSIGVPHSKNTGVSIGRPKPKRTTGAAVETAKSTFSSGVKGKGAVSSANKGKAIVTASGGEVITFRHAKYGLHEREVRFRLIHYWESRIIKTKVLLGIEMLLIDEESLDQVVSSRVDPPRSITVCRGASLGPVMKLHLWDEAALRFGEKFKASGGAARVVLVTTLNPKRFGFGVCEALRAE
ncbi:Uncharacterized protein Rs2_37085 [Raphanus sativus]|nr:Uncharacterized protein Rs2_37085 [Raphanus sativus]